MTLLTPRSTIVALALGVSAGAALAKLPAPSPEAAAKAAEATAKTAWSNKVAGYQLCQAQDRVAAKYRKAGQSAMAGACADPGPFSYTPPEAKPVEPSAPAPGAAAPKS